MSVWHVLNIAFDHKFIIISVRRKKWNVCVGFCLFDIMNSNSALGRTHSHSHSHWQGFEFWWRIFNLIELPAPYFKCAHSKSMGKISLKYLESSKWIKECSSNDGKYNEIELMEDSTSSLPFDSSYRKSKEWTCERKRSNGLDNWQWSNISLYQSMASKIICAGTMLLGNMFHCHLFSLCRGFTCLHSLKQ